MRRNLRSAVLLGIVALSSGCGGNPAPPRDSGNGTPEGDSGMVNLMCPIARIPMPTQQFGACCYRAPQVDHQDAPELRLRSLALRGPVGSALVLPIPTGQLLNASLADESFNWLFRVTGADGDGPVDIETGFGTRDAATGTYSFSVDPTHPEWDPITLSGTLTGEMLTTDAATTGLVIPVFDTTGLPPPLLQLSLHGVSLVSAELNDDRSCVGTIGARYMYTTGATLHGFIDVEEARASMIMVASINAQLCTLLASPSFSDPMEGPYCDQPRETWMVKPDSLCTGEVCVQNATGAEVCSEDGTGSLPACNAWLLIADFAAVGVDITD